MVIDLLLFDVVINFVRYKILVFGLLVYIDEMYLLLFCSVGQVGCFVVVILVVNLMLFILVLIGKIINENVNVFRLFRIGLSMFVIGVLQKVISIGLCLVMYWIRVLIRVNDIDFLYFVIELVVFIVLVLIVQQFVGVL